MSICIAFVFLVLMTSRVGFRLMSQDTPYRRHAQIVVPALHLPAAANRGPPHASPEASHRTRAASSPHTMPSIIAGVAFVFLVLMTSRVGFRLMSQDTPYRRHAQIAAPAQGAHAEGILDQHADAAQLVAEAASLALVVVLRQRRLGRRRRLRVPRADDEPGGVSADEPGHALPAPHASPEASHRTRAASSPHTMPSIM
jgi:hypothetical protein